MVTWERRKCLIIAKAFTMTIYLLLLRKASYHFCLLWLQVVQYYGLFNGHVIFRGKSIINGIRYSECVEPRQCIWKKYGCSKEIPYWWNPFSSPLEVYWQFFSSFGYSHLASGWPWPIPQVASVGMFPVCRLKPTPDKACGKHHYPL